MFINPHRQIEELNLFSVEAGLNNIKVTLVLADLRIISRSPSLISADLIAGGMFKLVIFLISSK